MRFCNYKLFMRSKIYIPLALLVAFAWLCNYKCYARRPVLFGDIPNVSINAIPANKNSVFKGNGTVNYTVKLSADGDLNGAHLFCHVFSNFGKLVYTESVTVSIAKDNKASYNFKFNCKEAGFYNVSFGFNSAALHDSIKRVFAYNPSAIKAALNKPADFDAFWKQSIDSLHTIPPQYKITEEKALSVNSKKVYLVEMHSWANTVIYAWLTIPDKRPSRIPVRYHLPGYLQKAEPDFDDNEFAVFSLDVRGNGISQKSLNTHGRYATIGIESKYKYIYRGAYMDCMRGLDFIFANAKLGLDTTRVLVEGTGQGASFALALAGLDKRVGLVFARSPLYAAFADAYKIACVNKVPNDPLMLVANYLKTKPTFKPDSLLSLWSYFDPLNFASSVKCPLFMGLNLTDDTAPAFCGQAFYNVLKNKDDGYYVLPEATPDWNKGLNDAQYFWTKALFKML